MKKYVSQMTPEEVVKLLKEGYAIKDNYNKYTKYRMIDGVLFDEAEIRLNCTLILDDEDLYFEIEEKFEITETGLYKTRDGRKVFVSYIEEDKDVVYTVYGMIEGEVTGYYWTKEGREIVYETNNTDIVSKWE